MKKYHLSLSPYQTKVLTYWRENSRQHPDKDFQSWLDKDWGATVGGTISDGGGQFQFENEQDAVMFALRWA